MRTGTALVGLIAAGAGAMSVAMTPTGAAPVQVKEPCVRAPERTAPKLPASASAPTIHWSRPIR